MVDVILLTAAGCHLCEDARRSLESLAREFDLSFREVDMTSDEGLELVGRHRPPMPPAVLIDGVLFSFGRLPRTKLRRRLERQVV